MNIGNLTDVVREIFSFIPFKALVDNKFMDEKYGALKKRVHHIYK